MKKIKYFFLFSFFCAAAFTSCKKDRPAEEKIDFGYNYFPGVIGSYIIYSVDSTHYDQAAHLPDTSFHYLLKEKIESTFLDNSNRPTFRIERYKKYYNDSIPYDSRQWALTDVWTETKTTATLEKKEENVIYVKLVFPVKKGKTWNGNAFNTFGSQEYEIIAADVPQAINNFNFDSVATVKQNENINVIENIYAEEKFARNLGLIYKQNDSLYFGAGDTVGYKVRQKIISYGK